MNRKTETLLAFVLVLAGTGVARAFEDYSGHWGGTWSPYGQFAPSVIGVGDGTGHKFAAVDNANSNSRLGFVMKRALGRGEFRFRFETGLGLRQSSEVSQAFTGDALDWTGSDIRFLDLIWDLGPVGTFSVGHGSMATDQVALADLSGTVLVTGVSVPDMAGSFLFRTTGGVLSPVSVKSAYKTYDGIRRARLRFDRPVARVAGLTLSVSAGAEILKKNNTETNVDVAATYERTTARFRMEGAIGASLTRQNNRVTRNDVVGSFSLLHRPSGVSVTAAASTSNTGGRMSYLKLGYLADLVAAGPTAISLDIYDGADIAVPGSRSRAWGVGIVQHLARPDIEIYLGARRYSYSDGSPLSYRPLRAIQFGTRWQF
ncbi:MAG: porin [Jhaorihella sp.]